MHGSHGFPSTPSGTGKMFHNRIALLDCKDIESFLSSLYILEIRKFAGKWMELEENILNEVAQTKKDKYDIYRSNRFVDSLIPGCGSPTKVPLRGSFKRREEKRREEKRREEKRREEKRREEKRREEKQLNLIQLGKSNPRHLTTQRLPTGGNMSCCAYSTDLWKGNKTVLGHTGEKKKLRPKEHKQYAQGIMGGCITEYTWRSEDNLQDSVLSFYYVGPKDETPVIRFVGQIRYP
ncbi:protein of unknown function DUF1725 containing protein [Cricetulus griseus]|nr:protein of unknown function DUF1725 containing protein [Cricetulus griseus]